MMINFKIKATFYGRTGRKTFMNKFTSCFKDNTAKLKLLSFSDSFHGAW